MLNNNKKQTRLPFFSTQPYLSSTPEPSIRSHSVDKNILQSVKIKRGSMVNIKKYQSLPKPSVTNTIEQLHQQLDLIINSRVDLENRIKSKARQTQQIKQLIGIIESNKIDSQNQILQKQICFNNGIYFQLQSILMDKDVLKFIMNRTKDDIIIIQKRINQIRGKHNTAVKMVEKLQQQLVNQEIKKNNQKIQTSRAYHSVKKQSYEVSRSISLAKKALLEHNQMFSIMKKTNLIKQQIQQSYDEHLRIKNLDLKKYHTSRIFGIFLDQKFQRLKHKNSKTQNVFQNITMSSDETSNLLQLYKKSFETNQLLNKTARNLQNNQKILQQRIVDLDYQYVVIKDNILNITGSNFNMNSTKTNSNIKNKSCLEKNWTGVTLWCQRVNKQFQQESIQFCSNTQTLKKLLLKLNNFFQL